MTHPSDWRSDWSSPLQALQEELNRVLAQFRVPRTVELRPGNWAPGVDLVEFPGELRLWVDLPGVPASSIDLTVNGTLLVLQGERAAVEAAQGRDHLRERPTGGFFRQVVLPCEVEADAIRAEARDGVLEVVLPKAEALRPRTIPIREA
jgi:HSP20 family protein